LVQVTVTNNWRSEFTYDGFGRRRLRTEYLWQNSAWAVQAVVRYVYDGLLVMQERDGNNVPMVTYTRGRDLSGSRQRAGGIGGLLARTDNASLTSGASGAHAFYHADGNGNITLLATDKASVAARYLYDPFGNLLAKAGPLADANLYRFSFKEAHPSSGLYYYGFRFYDQNLQRWLNRDPLADGGSLMFATATSDIVELSDFWPVLIGESDGVNQHLFVGNSPTLYWDAFGGSKGGRKNISCEGFTKQSDPADVAKALEQAKKLRQLKRTEALRALLKVIKRGGSMLFLFYLDFLEFEMRVFLSGYDQQLA
jgi:RHS repeat-associated protein